MQIENKAVAAGGLSKKGSFIFSLNIQFVDLFLFICGSVARHLVSRLVAHRARSINEQKSEHNPIESEL